MPENLSFNIDIKANVDSAETAIQELSGKINVLNDIISDVGDADSVFQEVENDIKNVADQINKLNDFDLNSIVPDSGATLGILKDSFEAQLDSMRSSFDAFKADMENEDTFDDLFDDDDWSDISDDIGTIVEKTETLNDEFESINKNIETVNEKSENLNNNLESVKENIEAINTATESLNNKDLGNNNLVNAYNSATSDTDEGKALLEELGNIDGLDSVLNKQQEELKKNEEAINNIKEAYKRLINTLNESSGDELALENSFKLTDGYIKNIKDQYTELVSLFRSSEDFIDRDKVEGTRQGILNIRKEVESLTKQYASEQKRIQDEINKAYAERNKQIEKEIPLTKEQLNEEAAWKAVVDERKQLEKQAADEAKYTAKEIKEYNLEQKRIQDEINKAYAEYNKQAADGTALTKEQLNEEDAWKAAINERKQLEKQAADEAKQAADEAKQALKEQIQLEEKAAEERLRNFKITTNNTRAVEHTSEDHARFARDLDTKSWLSVPNWDKPMQDAMVAKIPGEDTNVNDKINKINDTVDNLINNKLTKVGNIINTSINDPLSVSNDKLNKLSDILNKYAEKITELETSNIIPDVDASKLDTAKTNIQKFKQDVDNILKERSDVYFVDPSIIKEKNSIILDQYNKLKSSISNEIEKINQIEKNDADISEGITREKYNKIIALYNNFKQNIVSTIGNKSEEEIASIKKEISAFDEQIKKLDTLSKTYDELRVSKDLTSNVDDGLNDTNDAANKTKKTVEDAAKSFDLMSVAQKGASVASDLVKKAWEAADDALNKIIDSTKQLGDVIGTSIENIPDIINESIKKLDELYNKISNLADKGVDLQKKWFTMFNYLGAETGSEIQKYLDQIQSIYGIDSDNLIGSFRAISASVQNMGLNAQDSEKALKALMNFSIDASGFTGIDLDSITTQLQSSLNMGYIGKNSPIIQALGLTDQDVEQFKKLNNALERSNFLLKKGEALRGSYSKWNDTAAGKVRMLREAVSSLEGNVSRLALGLYSKLAPALTKIINLINTFVQVITKALGIDVNSAIANNANSIAGGFKGIENIPNDVDKLNNSNNKAADSTKKLADNTKKLQKTTDDAKKSILSFDDVIQLNKDDDTGIMSDDTLNNVDDGVEELDDLSEELNEVDEILKNIGIDSNNLAGIFDDWALPENLQEIVDTFEWVVTTLNEVGELLQNGAFFEAGKRLAGMFNALLGEIPWDEIKEKVNDFGKNIASFVNGIFSDSLLFNSIGDMIAQGFNTVIGLVLSFVSELNWEDIGIALAESWRGFWDGFDSEQLGETLYEVIHGAFKTLWGFLQTMWTDDPDTGLNGWKTTGIKLADVINEFVHSFTPGDAISAAQEIMSFINGIFTTLGSFIEEMDTEDLKNKAMSFLRSIFTSFNEHAEEWGTTVGEFVDFIIDLINGTIETYDSTGMNTSISKFLRNAKIGDLVATLIWAEFRGKLSEKLQGAGIILTALTNIFNRISSYVRDRLSIDTDVIEEWIGWFFQGIADGAAEIITTLGEVFGAFRDENKNLISAFIDGICKLITLPLKVVVSSSATAINGVINLIGKIPGIKIDGISDKITAGKDSILNFIDNIKIPKLATGGILTQATTIIAGEQGKEAVLPLENNTGWMDNLAQKLSTQINNNNNTYNNNSGPVNINLPNKAVYTQAELLDMGRLIAEALSLYGVNVSIN